MKRLELGTEWSKAPIDDDFCHTHPAYRQLVREFSVALPSIIEPSRRFPSYQANTCPSLDFSP